MNKNELVDAISKKSGLSKADANKAVDALVETVGETLAAGGDITLVGFGRFHISSRAPRQGRNPQTGEVIEIKGGNIPRFTPGKSLKEKVSG